MTVPLEKFARFFRVHGLAIGLIVSALPIGSSALGLLPYFGSTKVVFGLFVTLSSVLVISLLFALRRHVAPWVFPPKRLLTEAAYKRQAILIVGVPTALTVLSAFSTLCYVATVEDSVNEVAVAAALSPTDEAGTSSSGSGVTNLDEYLRSGHDRGVGHLFDDPAVEMRIYASGWTTNPCDSGCARHVGVTYMTKAARTRILADTPANQVPSWVGQAFWLVLMFATAAGCLVWTGLIDYVQGEAGISDEDLFKRPYRTE